MKNFQHNALPSFRLVNLVIFSQSQPENFLEIDFGNIESSFVSAAWMKTMDLFYLRLPHCEAELF